MGNFKIKSIWESKNTGGGNVPADLEQRVQTLENDTVKLSGAQNISGVKTITATGEVLKLNSGTDTSAYMSGYKSGNQRIWYFGKGSSSTNDFYIGADRGTVILEASSNVHLKAANIIHCNSKKLTNVAEPAANTDAATKQYVDNKIQKRVVDATISVGTTYVVQASNGYEIISIMVGRKRTSDNFYFFTHPSVNLNFQFFAKTDGSYNIYTEGAVNGFNNEYKIYLLEKKL